MRERLEKIFVAFLIILGIGLAMLLTAHESYAARVEFEGGGGGGAVTTEPYVTIGNTAGLSAERALTGTANEITVTDDGANTTVTLSLPSTIDLGGKTSFEIPNAAAPTVDAFGEIAGDNNLWAASRGAPVFFDGTAATALVNVLVSDAPSNGQVPQWNTGGTITWETAAGSMSIGGTVTSGTTGSVLFVGSGPVLAQDNANIFWDDTANRLGILTASPGVTLDVRGTTYIKPTGSTPTMQIVAGTDPATTVAMSTDNTAYGWQFGPVVSDSTQTVVQMLGQGFGGGFSGQYGIYLGTHADSNFQVVQRSGNINLVNVPRTGGMTLLSPSGTSTTLTINTVANTGASVLAFQENAGADAYLEFINSAFATTSRRNYLEVYNANTTGGVSIWTNGTLQHQIDENGDMTVTDGNNFILSGTTGTKIGTATSQKIGIWNATPIVQPTTAIAAATFVANTSLIANDTATFDGYTLGQVVKALRNLGILA